VINPIATPDWSSLPVPVDDGAAQHLVGMRWPEVGLRASDGRVIDVSKLKGWTAIFIYPRTGRPGVENPAGWDLIPGARGCTPQSCAFRDRFADLKAAGVEHVFGMSTQVPEYQREAAERLHLPFALLSDAELKVAGSLRLPMFEIDGPVEGEATGAEESATAEKTREAEAWRSQVRLLKRVTLMVRQGKIEHVFYPVFPPDRNANEVVAWMKKFDREIR
jgi:peroxiredoxin